jgi:hypothetical protein
LALLVAGCSKPQSDTSNVAPPVPSVVPPAPPPPRQVIRTNWTFASGNDECVAVAAGGGTSLRVTVRRDAPIDLTVTLSPPVEHRLAAHAATPLRFAGSAGHWQVSAQQTASHQLAVTLGSGDMALSRVLVLLSGGVLDVQNPDQVILSLTIVPSDAAGQLWFDCARREMF